MSLPLTGTYSSPNAGKLRATLSAQFYANTYRDAGFPSSGNAGSSNLSIRGYIGPSGSPTYTPIIEKYSGTSYIELDYPGGNVPWPCGIEEVAHLNPSSGLWSYGFSNIKLSFVLQKK